MRDQIEYLAAVLWAWIQNEYERRGERNRLHFLALLLGPLLASAIFVQMQHQQEQEQYDVGLFGFLWNSATMGTASLVLSVWHLTLRIVGVALGIGLGLGLAGHVYDALSDAQDDGDGEAGRPKRNLSEAAARPDLPSFASMKSNKLKMELAGMDDVNSYHALMRSAGYAVDGGTLRAQMVRGADAAEASAANEAKRELVLSQLEEAEPSSANAMNGEHPRVSLYRFDKGTTAAARMKCMWPNLAPVVNDALAKLTEFVLRDYVSVWYAKLDEHVVYEDPAPAAVPSVESSSDLRSSVTSSDGRPSTAPAEGERRRSSSAAMEGKGSFRLEDPPHSFSEVDDAQQQQQRQRSGSNAASRSTSLPSAVPTSRRRQSQQQRTMVLTATGTQPSPFVESLYACFAYLFGMLATRASENVNVLELLLLHFPHILGQNLREYRQMRNAALEKQQRRVAAEREKWRRRGMNSPSASFERAGSLSASMEGEVSEIAIVREYLLAGRFHRAVTFGLDVPSLLFADPLAKDCPPGPSYQGNTDIDRLNGHPDEDAILHDRLLSPEATLIDECELDYNRVLASRLTRLAVPKTESDSSVIRTLLVEILSSCVLGPIMGCFHPDSVNGWVIKGLGLLEAKGAEEGTTDANAGASDAGVTTNASTDIVRVVSSDLESNEPAPTATGVASEEELLDKIVDGVMDDIASEGSVTSEMGESLFSFDESNTARKEISDNSGKAEQIITMLSMSIIELGSFVDFEDCRYAREHGQDIAIDWDAQNCRNSVRHLVLVIEAALLLGIRPHPKRQRSHLDRGMSEFEIEATLEEGPDIDEFEVDINDGLVEKAEVKSAVLHSHSSLSAALMELTGDVDAFERLVEDSEHEDDDESLEDDYGEGTFIPSPSELSTLRTLIAAWLHTGQAFKVLSIVVRAKKTILRRFYHKRAFLRRANYASDFTRLLRQLDGVDILVDTMAVLASQCLLVGSDGFEGFMRSIQGQHKARTPQKQEDPFASEMRGRQRPQVNATNVNSMSVVGSVKANLAQNRDRIARFAQSATEIDLNPFKQSSATTQPPSSNVAFQQNSQITPAYLAFSTNDVFASSLRSERARRKKSWSKETKERKKLDFVCRTKGVKDKDIMLHRELHHLSRFFYSNTNEVRIDPCSVDDDESPQSAANVTIKAVGTRRKIEVPDEDSSFLLRAQPRPLKPVAIQRDQRNPNVACKVYVAMYEEPAIHPKTKRFYGGRYLRQCLMRYYPNDKTASVSVAQKVSALDRRNQAGGDKFVLSEDFQKLRHTCLKVATGGILSSPLMEPGDFCSTPRTGRALDFAYRVSLFERPLVELGGKKFVVHDASSHRADASALELSDASMTAALALRGSSGLNICDSSQGSFSIKVSDEGTPLVLLRANRDGASGSSPKTKDEARPYRPSFIRAALLVKSAKQEAQSQCLLHCIQTGSARSSTKVKSDEWLQPTLTLLQYANSRRQEEQSALLRDLRFGMNHIDRGQLSRNGLLNPRYPTILRGLNTKVEGVVEVKTSEFDLLATPLVLFRIRCTAIAEYVGMEEDDEDVEGGDAASTEKTKGKTRFFREEWTILRSLRDFGVFHRHVKCEVAPTEHSASTGAKLVGSVSAALTIVGGSTTAERQRGPLVPSLSQATKTGTLGLSTKKVMEKRQKLLDQYLRYLVSPKNLLSRCPELLKFLGAYTPVFPVEGEGKTIDEYGREDIRRVELVTEKLKAGIVQVKQGTEQVSVVDISTKDSVEESVTTAVASPKAESVDDAATVSTTVSTADATTATAASQEEPELDGNKKNLAARRMAMIRAGEIRLKDVRRSVFRLLKHLFDLDNASFFRSRIISVLKTMSVAVTSVQDFHRLLFQNHLTYMNGDWMSGWIYYFVDMFWPNGVFYTKAPPMTEEELLTQKQECKQMLERMFPDQLRTVLGKHTDEGLDLLHEMLQNRLVLKSMAYMIMDLVWAELFPELSDFVTGAECLEKEA